MLFLLCSQSVKTGGDQLVAALQHRNGPSAVHGATSTLSADQARSQDPNP